MHVKHSSTSPRKSSRHSSASSNAILPHPTPLSTLEQGIAVPSGAHSLAHELAVALMPDPAGGASRLLAEEFGIEYDEGAQGIDDDPLARHNHEHASVDDAHGAVLNGGASLADELGESTPGSSLAAEFGNFVDDELHGRDDGGTRDQSDIDRASDDEDEDANRRAALAQDAMEVLAQNLASTDRFLTHLRTIDTTFTLESLATDMISGLNDAVRDREGQVRELISHDRDLKRIATEVGGMDVLGDLDPLEILLSEDEPERQTRESYNLDSVAEEEEIAEGDSLYAPSLPSSPQKRYFAPVCASSSTSLSSSQPANKTSQQPQSSISTLNIALPSMTHMRSHTASFLASLTIISEQSQVNSAATADAGRKIRSVKNQLAKWKMETEGAERSRLKIEKWEAESIGRRDGRVVVNEHMRAFERAIMEAGMKTQAIMAR
ncbi:hypothetical protein JVT61DRAFT_63 [Boletus reticuloceps]|uniref:Uncharacterized protein n=1 Tax=Boletus reticuloceps TaxID=495285 RepID=A0A8I3AFG0_9AGAM|nr:hypothetical protein JVT61DRAFT_63 [Boletus reticuloceps]